jgi:tetratricopeptide (TPR) repeat protein
MKQWAYFVFISVLTVICVCFIVLNMRSVSKVASATIELKQNRKAIADLEGQIKKAGSERDLANQKVGRLQAEISSLLKQRKADLQEIENLRKSLEQKTVSEAKQDAGEQQVVEQGQRQQVKDAEDAGRVREQPVKYDAEMVMDMISSGGSLQDAIRRIITTAGIDSTLQQHGEDPAHLVAAASLTQDPEVALDYLEQAAVIYPDSSMAISSLINAQIAHDKIDESTLTYIDQLKKIDPTNALADCYAAYYQFNSGNVEAALQSLSQASVKDRFADGSIDLLMARYDYFLNEGCTDSVSLGLSAFDLPFSYMSMLREIGDSAMQQAEELSVAGQYENALQIVTNTSKLGGTLSSSGRFIVSDRVGMALQISALEKQKQICEALGDVAKIEEVDAQLQAVQQRSGEIDIMVQAFGGVLQNMTDQDIADYVNSTILNGEFSTLQNIPEIAVALEQARLSSSSGQSGGGSTNME